MGFLGGGFARTAPRGRWSSYRAREEAFQAVALGGGERFGVVVRKVGDLQKRVVLLGQGRESLLSPTGAALSVMQQGRCCWGRCLGVSSRRKQPEAGNREDTGQAQQGDGEAATNDQIEDQEDEGQDKTGDEGAGRNRYIQ